MAQFEMDTFARSHDLMSSFWNACYDAMMSSSQRREQEKAASSKLFQVLPAPHPWDVTLGCAPQPGDTLLTPGMSSRDVLLILGTCSSPQGCHPGNMLFILGMSS